VSKAFGAGADFVMLGGMFAGHDQSGGNIVEREGKKFKLFYGMSSATAMQKYHGGVKDYRSEVRGHVCFLFILSMWPQGIRRQECGAAVSW